MKDTELVENYLGGADAQIRMEDLVMKMFKPIGVRVGGSPSDWSLEIYLTGMDFRAFILTKENQKTILGWGCTHFWIQFLDTGRRSEAEKYRRFYLSNAEIFVTKHAQTLTIYFNEGKDYQQITIKI